MTYTYDFNVFGPVLALSLFGSSNASAEYLVSINVDGTSVWESYARLNGNLGGHVLVEDGTDLGGTFFTDLTYPSNIFGYTFSDFSDVVSLGTFADGASFDFEASIEVYVDASRPSEVGALARIGDPGDISGGRAWRHDPVATDNWRNGGTRALNSSPFVPGHCGT